MVVRAIPNDLASTYFLNATPPVASIVAQARANVEARVVSVTFNYVASRDLDRLPNVHPSNTRRYMPRPRINDRFHVIPNVATCVMLPFVTRNIVDVRRVAVIPRTVPFVLLSDLRVRIRVDVRPFLRLNAHQVTAIKRTPCAGNVANVRVLQYAAREHIFHRLNDPLNRAHLTSVEYEQRRDRNVHANRAMKHARPFLRVLVANLGIIYRVIMVARIRQFNVKTPRPYHR